MLVALIAFDKPGALATRKENREAHLTYIEATGIVAQAGPLLSDTGDMVGSLLILDVPSVDVARAWADEDPYAKAGLFERVTIREWKRVVG